MEIYKKPNDTLSIFSTYLFNFRVQKSKARWRSIKTISFEICYLWNPELRWIVAIKGLKEEERRQSMKTLFESLRNFRESDKNWNNWVIFEWGHTYFSVFNLFFVNFLIPLFCSSIKRLVVSQNLLHPSAFVVYIQLQIFVKLLKQFQLKRYNLWDALNQGSQTRGPLIKKSETGDTNIVIFSYL